MTKALIADDSSSMRKVLVSSLAECGIDDVSEASDGGEALRLFADQPFDLVLTEWNMPSKTGLEVTQSIRADGGRVPIIMVTAEAEKTRVIEAIKAGVTDYLIKPFTPEMLREKIERVLGQLAGQGADK